jgi:DNA replication protein DnaC
MSIIVQNTSQMRGLRLSAMAAAYENQLLQPKLHELPFDDRLALLLEAEDSSRRNRKLSRLVRQANLREHASLEDLDYRPGRGLDKAMMASLATCGWISRHQNLLVLGPTGVGKTWVGCAIGHQACRIGMTVAFHRLSDLFDEIAEAHHDGTLPKLKLALAKPNLLILDDFGIGDMSTSAAQVLLDVIDSRQHRGSLLVTSQYPIDTWHGLFPDQTIADAVLDRFVHNSHRLNLKGESMRKVRAKMEMESLQG